jgi:hypothetical protein
MAYPGEKALWGLLERARILRRDAFKLSRQLGKTCDEIKAHDVELSRAAGKDRPSLPAEKKAS